MNLSPLHLIDAHPWKRVGFATYAVSLSFFEAVILDRLVRGRKAKLTPDRAAYFAHPDWVVRTSAKAPSSLWAPRIPTEQGLAATARWYEEQGWL